MGIWLVMKTADGNERPFLIEKSKTVIGRETKCDLRIAMPSVSGQHCVISLEDEKLRLTDLNSSQGTFHNGDRVDAAELAHEDTLTVGPVTFEVRVVPGQGPEITRRI